MLRLENLDAGYGDLTIVRGASFEVVAGEIMAVLGHNGVGKSTLLRAIMGLRRPTAGTVRQPEPPRAQAARDRG
jgi:branched-chain amino acid transport system ATP-binding protein